MTRFGVALDFDRKRDMRKAERKIHQPLVASVKSNQSFGIEIVERFGEQRLPGCKKGAALRIARQRAETSTVGGTVDRPLLDERVERVEPGRQQAHEACSAL